MPVNRRNNQIFWIRGFSIFVTDTLIITDHWSSPPQRLHQTDSPPLLGRPCCGPTAHIPLEVFHHHHHHYRHHRHHPLDPSADLVLRAHGVWRLKSFSRKYCESLTKSELMMDLQVIYINQSSTQVSGLLPEYYDVNLVPAIPITIITTTNISTIAIFNLPDVSTNRCFPLSSHCSSYCRWRSQTWWWPPVGAIRPSPPCAPLTITSLIQTCLIDIVYFAIDNFHFKLTLFTAIWNLASFLLLGFSQCSFDNLFSLPVLRCLSSVSVLVTASIYKCRVANSTFTCAIWTRTSYELQMLWPDIHKMVHPLRSWKYQHFWLRISRCPRQIYPILI